VRLRLRTHQGGMGMLSVIVIISLIAFFLTLLFKLGPAYMNFWTVRSIMNRVANPSEPIEGGARGIVSQISRQMEINNVGQVTPKDFKVTRTGENSYEVKLDYEQRQHVLYNVDAVLTFDHQVEVKAP